MALTAHSCRESIIDDIIEYDELTQPVFNLIREERKKIIAKRSVAKSESHEPTFSRPFSFAGMEDASKVAFVLEESELSVADLALIMRADSEQLNELIVYALQLPMKQKVSLAFLVKCVCCSSSGKLGTLLAAAA